MGRHKSETRKEGDIRDIRVLGKSIFGYDSGAHGDASYREIVSIYEGLWISSAFAQLTANLEKDEKTNVTRDIASDIYHWRNK